MSYEDSLAAEKKVYENCVDVHDLPPIFHYWSNRHLLPKLQPFGFSSPTGMFAAQVDSAWTGPALLSLGSGNCDLEIDLALTLKNNGREFTIDCLDLNPVMLERGRLAAQSAGLSRHLQFIPADLNSWQACGQYDAIIANQSLHHVVNLEGLLDQVKQALRPGGRFLVSDMIGRNGHQRWPEALEIVHEFWRKLPPSCRFNQKLGCYEELYQNWDCSVQGFEGVRSQDILPLLLDRFHFCLFLTYGNVIDPFIDRAFGPHFDPSSAWDRNFIDQVHQRDEQELASGRLKPTHMIAVLTNEPCAAPHFGGPFPPEFCVRNPEQDPSAVCQPPLSPYEWSSWPHATQKELEVACDRLADAGHEIAQRTRWALDLDRNLKERTAWALSLEKEVKEVEERTAWALRIEKQLEERTAWTVLLRRELGEQTARANHLNRLIHNPKYLLTNLVQKIRNAFRS